MYLSPDRGAFALYSVRTEKSEDLIRSHDSYHKIYVGRVGRPMPVTQESTWSKEVNEVDMEKKVSKIVSEDVKAKRQEEKQKVNEIREREKNLKEIIRQ